MTGGLGKGKVQLRNEIAFCKKQPWGFDTGYDCAIERFQIANRMASHPAIFSWFTWSAALQVE
jgi:hypothetical protein